MTGHGTKGILGIQGESLAFDADGLTVYMPEKNYLSKRCLFLKIIRTQNFRTPS
jgi:hypothetical protein